MREKERYQDTNGLSLCVNILVTSNHQRGPTMATPSSERVTCPNCGKGYRWQTKLIGRRVPCKQCNEPFDVPEAPGEGIAIAPAVTEDGTYELDFDEAADAPASPAAQATPASGGKCPSCNSAVREGAVLCMNCGFNMAEGKKVQTAVAPVAAEPDPSGGAMTKKQQREMEQAEELHAQHFMMNYKAPIILIIIGFALVLLNNLVLGPMAPMYNEFYSSKVDIMVDLTIVTALYLVISSALLFAGLFILIWLFSSGFGTLGSVLLKVLAITLLAQEATALVIIGLDVMMGTGGLGWFIGWGAYITAMIILCMKFLDVDFTEFRILFWFIIIGRYLTEFLLGIVIGGVF